jgi:hypothetical protein
MSIPKLLKHYNLNPAKLKFILKRYNVNDNIRFINHIPEEWILILLKETGIKEYEISTKIHSRSYTVKEDKGVKATFNSLDQLQELSKIEQSKNQFQIGYIKYVAPDYSHAYLKVIDDINNVLFGQKNFIESNSYLTGHDNINVFGQVEMKYFIKAGNSAIDIQLKR